MIFESNYISQIIVMKYGMNTPLLIIMLSVVAGFNGFFVGVGVSATYFEALDDAILNKVIWAGALPEDTLQDEMFESIVMMTARNEKYRCMLPKPLDASKDDAGAYSGLNPFELISPLITKFVCTFKLETYWTYELCHGKYIRQYHEERDGKKVKMQEYFLGRWQSDDLQKTKTKVETDFMNPDIKSHLPTKRVEGVTMPALQLNMSDGTQCDLNGDPRSTRVLYVCDPRGNHEIYSLEEVSTCEYEIVVLSPLLCQHPDFKSKETGENLINCHPLAGAPTTPKALLEMETESFKMRHEHLLQNLESLLDTKLKSEAKSVELTNEEREALKSPKTNYQDHNFLSGFLSGKNCLTGGSHWWKFEFCFGKYVLQYHEQEGGSRTEIMLGKWNEDKHKEWIDKNPQKRPSLSQIRKAVIHYYTGGAPCDQSAVPRTVEVKFRCVESPSSSSVAVYLLEPNTCEYALSVESSLFCPLLKTANEFGLFDSSEFMMSTKKSTSSEKVKRIKNGDELEIILADDEAQPAV